MTRCNNFYESGYCHIFTRQVNPSECTREKCGAYQAKPCEWSQDGDATWWTACGRGFMFNVGGPKEYFFTACPFCGGPIVVKEAK